MGIIELLCKNGFYYKAWQEDFTYSFGGFFKKIITKWESFTNFKLIITKRSKMLLQSVTGIRKCIITHEITPNPQRTNWRRGMSGQINLHKICKNKGFHWPVFSRILVYFMQCWSIYFKSVTHETFSCNWWIFPYNSSSKRVWVHGTW